MTRNDFEGLYQIFLRCFTDKLWLQVRGYSSRWPVASINKSTGRIYLVTIAGIECHHYRSVVFPDIKKLYGDESVKSIADRINRGEKIYL